MEGVPKQLGELLPWPGPCEKLLMACSIFLRTHRSVEMQRLR